jgi:hypothetical protein
MEAIMSRNKIEAKGSAFSVSPEKDNTVSRDGIARQTNLRFGHCAITSVIAAISSCSYHQLQ